jgi:hypothetical protein
MAKAFVGWKPLAHGPIEKLAENLWRVEGTLPRMSLRRTMTIARLTDGRLVVHGPIALDEAAMTQIETWGTPAFLVVPSAYHRLDAPAYKQRYANLTVLAPRGARARIQEVVPVDGSFEDFPPGERVRLERLEGVGDLEGVMVVDSPDGSTVVLGDIVFNMDRKRDPLGFLFTSLLGSAPGPRISRLAKAALVKDRAALRRDLERLATLPGLQRLIVAHEKVASGTAAPAALRTAATYL